MNKSLEYIKKRIEEGNCDRMSMEEFSDMGVFPFKQFFREDVGDTMILALTKDQQDVFADLTYNPNADFNYFTLKSCVCDGTLVFMTELMEEILKKIGRLETCYAPIIRDIPQEEIQNYKLHYEVGDFITNTYIVAPPDKDKPWMCDKFTVMLPIKFTVEKVR